jgi:predicted PurR-regulated permease PerM
MKRIAWYAFVIMATLAGLILLWQFSLAIILFLLSLVVGSALRPSVSGLQARGLSRPAAMAMVYASLVLAIAALLVLFTRPVAADFQEFADDAVTAYERVKMEWPRGGTMVQRTLVDQLPPTEDFYNAFSSEGGLTSVIGVIGAAQNVLTALARAAIVIVLSTYWSADPRRFAQLIVSPLPPEHHKRARRAWAAVETGVGAYVRGEIVQSLLAGIILGVSFWLLGIHYPALFALWVAIVRLIPWFGTLLAILPALLAILVGAPALGIAAVLVTLTVLPFLRLVVGQRYFTPKRYSGLWLVTVVIALAELWGAGGALIAPVIAVALQLLAEHLIPQPTAQRLPEISVRVESLRKRVDDLAGGLPFSGNEIQPETRLEIDRLRTLLRALTARVQESHSAAAE